VRVGVAKRFGCGRTKSTRFPLGKTLKWPGPTEPSNGKTQGK